MITIIADKYGHANPPVNALIATKIGDYMTIRRRIRVALDQDESLIIYATNPVIVGWLSDLQRYPESRLIWQVIDPADTFTRLFGMAPANPFTRAHIAALQLNELPRLPTGVIVHPLSWILGHRLDPLWQYDDPPPGHVAQLAAWAINQPGVLDSTLVPLIQAQLDRWSEELPLYQALHAASLFDNSKHLLVRWGLQRYDQSWQRLQPWGNLPLLDAKPAPSALITALREYDDVIQDYWHHQIASTPIDVNLVTTALAQMSGLSEAEILVLNTMLNRQPEALDDHLLQAIKNQFLHLPMAQHVLQNLATQVTPPEPPLPDFTWTTDHWLRWATQQYMPYYAWVINTGRGRTHQQACALRYSDWLYTQYPSWLNDDQSPLLLRQYQDMSTLVDSDQQIIVIWLIIDGMTWWQGNLMREICERYGLHTQVQRAGIAILPSITSVSKRALVTGQPTIDLTQKTISDAARVKLAQSTIPAKVGYNLSATVEDLQRGDAARVFIVLFNLLDALAHQTATFTDNPGIRGYLEDLASKLRSAQQACLAHGRQLHVLIGSDHGSTLLPADAPSIPLPQTVREIDDIWEPELPGQEAQRPGTRAAATDLDRIPSVDQQIWYMLDRDGFQLDRHYLVPRGYRYIKRRPTGWTHGGLTPEETIVPLLHLTTTLPHLIALHIEFHGTLRVGQAGTITATVRNPNPFPVEDLTLRVSEATDKVTIIYLGALEQQEVEILFAAITAQGSELPIPYEVRYNALGIPRYDTAQAQISLRRLQTEDTAFDDMFN